MKTVILYREIVGFWPNRHVCYEIMNKGYNHFFEGRTALRDAKKYCKQEGFINAEIHISNKKIVECVL
jgi:hypothetical protein